MGRGRSQAGGAGRDRLERLLSARPSVDFQPSGAMAARIAPAAAEAQPVGWNLVRDTYRRTQGFLFIVGLVVGAACALALLPEGQDLVTTVAEDGRGQALWLAIALVWAGLQAWFWMRRIVEANYGADRRWGAAEPFLVWAPRLTGWCPLLVVSATFLADRFRGWIDQDVPRGPPLVEALLVVFCVGYLVFVMGRTRWPPLARLSGLGPWWMWPLVSGAGSMALLIVFTFTPVGFAQAVGPAAVVFLGVASILPVMSLAIQLGGAKAFPIVPTMLGAAAVFSLWTDGQHAVGGRLFGRLPPPLPSVVARPDLDQAFDAWTRAQGEAPKVLAVVAAEGGASRAGVWTAVALQRLNGLTGGALARRTFALSSISGGSVGAVGWAASLRAPACAAATEPGRTHDGAPLASTCLERFVGEDGLSPALAAMLYPDLIQRFLPAPVLPDRARALELSWEGAWRRAFGTSPGAPDLGAPYRTLWRAPTTADPAWAPFVVVGGTSEESGRRILTSPVRLAPDFAPGEHVEDVYDLYGRDLAASTAILDGARFPWVSPAGRLAGAGGVRHVVDGGYFDASGIQTARALLRWVAARRPDLPLLLIVIRYEDAPAKAARRGVGWTFANDALAPAVAGLGSRSALQEHFEDAPPAAPAPRELVLKLSGTPCEGLPLNWMLSRKARRYVESLGADDAAGAALAAAAAVVLAGDAPPPPPPLVRDRFSCPAAARG